ncbi:MAG: hydroxyisourate hydrolase [Betaproteobacteria bacterium]
MSPEILNRRKFLAAGAALSAAAAIPGQATVASDRPLVLAQNAPPSGVPGAAVLPGRLTFHGIDTYHGATIGTLKVDVSMLEGGSYRPVKSFDTAANGRSDGSIFEGATFKPGRYEVVMHVGDYYAALGTKLPSPTFLSRVPLRFGIADARERYHIAVLFGPWSYAYYRGS